MSWLRNMNLVHLFLCSQFHNIVSTMTYVWPCTLHSLLIGFITQPWSPFAAPIVWGKNCNQRLTSCTEYIDVITKPINNWYPLPFTSQKLNLLPEAKIYLKLTIVGTENPLGVNRWDEHKFAFLTRYLLIEPMVMQMRKTNTAGDYPEYINNTSG